MRFYNVTWRAEGRPLAIDLVGAPSGERGSRVGELAQAIKAFGAGARTELGVAPAEGAVLSRLTDYLWSDQRFNAPPLTRHLSQLRAGGAPHAFTLRVGLPAEGGDLVGREGALSEAGRRLQARESLHLMAPRRYGKTSFLRRLAADLRSAGRRVVMLDAENLDSVSAFAVALAAQALADGASGLRSVPELAGWPLLDASAAVRVDAKATLLRSVERSPGAFLDGLLSSLAADGALLFIDEFSRFLLTCAARRSELQQGMAAFQRARRDAGLTSIVAGSSGLRSFIASQGMNEEFADLGALTLDPLTPEVGAVLVEELCYGHSRAPSAGVVAEVLERIGAPVPYFLQALVHHTLAEGHAALDGAAVGRAYRRRLLDVEGNEFFRPFRLKERGYRPEWLAPAAKVLARLARAEAPVSAAELRALVPSDFHALLAALAEDYDIVENEAGLALRSKVLRERWALRESWLTGG